jgi:RND family efflux transporter MFP subunit
MIKIITLISAMILLVACGQEDKQAQLKELESQRDALTARIDTLRLQIAHESGDIFSGKITYIKIQKLQRGEFRHYIKVQGTVESDNNILIPAQTSGIVKKITVMEGEKVRTGQVLAELDGAIYERNISEIKTNLELAQTIFERQERLWKKNIGSEVQYLQAKANKESLEKRLATVEEQYRLTKIISPINGNVDQIMIKEGEAAAAGFGTIRVVEASNLKISTLLSENYLDQVRVGDTVEVSIPTINKSIKTTVRAVSQVIDSKNRYFPIEINVPLNMPEIKPNMLVVLSINNYTNKNALAVPINAAQKSGEGIFLFTAKKNDVSRDIWQVSKRTVEPGIASGKRIEIKKGLDAGEFVVVFGFQDLADGQRVKISSASE